MSSEILVEQKASPMKLEVLGVFDWPIWKKEKSIFEWKYAKQETCYIIRGKFTVTPENGQPQLFQRGDLITFPKDLKCTWEIHEDVEKHFDYQ
tara:strand:- start:113 stop:391 length:279 start_codon:yes stop_codon:yes gene_type:complete